MERMKHQKSKRKEGIMSIQKTLFGFGLSQVIKSDT